MGENSSVSQEGFEKMATERDSQMRQSGEGVRNDVETGAHTSVDGVETAPPMAQEMASRLTKARVMEVVDPCLLYTSRCV